MGAGHSVTALYEIVPVGVQTDVTIRLPDSLRYQSPPASRDHPGSELGFVKVRYKQPDGDRSRLLTHPVSLVVARHMSPDFQFQAAVAEFGLLLKGSAYRGSASFAEVVETAKGATGGDADGYRAEFVRLARAAQSLGLAQVEAPR
jgi:Ca-activated chloride channel family protein